MAKVTIEITVEIGGKEHTLSLEEALELYQDLKRGLNIQDTAPMPYIPDDKTWPLGPVVTYGGAASGGRA